MCVYDTLKQPIISLTERCHGICVSVEHYRMALTVNSVSVPCPLSGVMGVGSETFRDPQASSGRPLKEEITGGGRDEPERRKGEKLRSKMQRGDGEKCNVKTTETGWDVRMVWSILFQTPIQGSTSMT